MGLNVALTTKITSYRDGKKGKYEKPEKEARYGEYNRKRIATLKKNPFVWSLAYNLPDLSGVKKIYYIHVLVN